MAKVKIDRLDLKKRKADLERGQLEQQVHIRLDSKGSRQTEAEEAETWQELRQTEGELGPGEIPPSHSFLNKVEEKFSKIKKNVASLKMSKKREEPPEQAVVIRSSQPEQFADEPKDDNAVNLRQVRIRSGAKGRKRSGAKTASKSFEEKIAERTALRIKAGDGVEIVRPQTFEAAAAGAYNRSLLDNGLKLITAPIQGTKTVTAMVMFGTGAKYESLSMSGLSHFLEHLFFKGTKKRPNAQKLSSDLDALGCEYNAFTAKEYTGYWIKVDSSKIALAMDILSDMLLNSEFSSTEINKERGVIIEEINMYHENPMMYIEDVFEACLYGDTPAGREIAGTKANIQAFKRQNFMNYFTSQYGANSAVLCLAGNIDERTERLAARYFGKMPRSPFKDKIRTADAQRVPAVRMHYKEGNQAIISLGVRAYDTYHEDKIILKVLAVLLGGSMSSRMFSELREKRGLAYFVHTTAETYTDTGYLTTQAGIPVGKQDQAVKVILSEYKKLRTKLVGKEELKRAKDLIRGRTVIGFEASDNVANWYAQREVLKEALLTPEEYFTKIDKIKAEDIRRVAKDIFKNEKLNLAVIGPFQDEAEFEKIVKF
ncbi:MAG: pitrilysin family protein [Patescibacteria group bacterium]|nr:pitrilysin family protein [Patescibacteria group bacterium]